MGALFGSSINCCTDLIYLHANTAIYGLIGAFFGVKFYFYLVYNIKLVFT